MKKHTSIKAIRNNYKTFRTGYCDLQYIMKFCEPEFYNSGVYGWNCDVYTFGGIAITTGYRNMAGVMIPEEIINKYSDNARNIMKFWTARPYHEIKTALDKNRENFLDELRNM